MSNQNRPVGLFPLEVEPSQCHIYKADTSHALYRYTPVARLANGAVGLAGALTDGSAMLGSVVGFLDINRAGFGTNLEDNPYLPKDTDGYVIVADNPNQRFLIQADTSGTDLAQTDVGASCHWSFLQASSGNTSTGIANVELDQSTVAADTGGQLLILDRYDQVDNAWGEWAKIVVKVLHHQNAGGNTGAAV